MRITLYGNKFDVDRCGEKFKSETAWWHALKKELNHQGHDLVKKLMSRDGFMYGSDEYPYYLRDRKREYYFYDPEYAIRYINEPERVTLLREVWK